jgi:hypothetical protein
MTTEPDRSRCSTRRLAANRRYEFICVVDALAPIDNARRWLRDYHRVADRSPGSGIIFEQRGRTIGLSRLGAHLLLMSYLTSKRTVATRLSASRHFVPDARRKHLLVQRRPDKATAVKLMRNLLKKQGIRARCAGGGQAALLRRGKVRSEIVGSPRATLAQ